MKTITLKKMVLDNIFGITDSYDTNPGRNVLSGPNGAGKTRRADAEQFVLWGKNLEQNTKSEVKSLVNGEIQLDSEHSAFLEYDINGEKLQIGRLIKVKWTQPRKAVEKVRSGNDIIYFKDGMDKESAESITAKQFSDLILEKFGPDYQKVSIINFVSSMPWKERRDLLTGLAPVDKEKIIDSIAGFREQLDGKTPEKRKERAEKRLTDKNNGIKVKLASNESAIEERKKDLEKRPGLSKESAQKQVDEAEQQINNCKIEIEKLKRGDSGQVEKIKALNQELTKLTAEFENKKQAARNLEQARQRNIKGIENELQNLNEDLKDHQELIETLKKEFSQIAAAKKAIRETTAETLSDICEHCGQTLPGEVFNKLKENFMSDRARKLQVEQEKLDQNNARGMDCKKEIERILNLIADSTNRLNDLKDQKTDPIINQEYPEGWHYLKEQISRLSFPVENNPELQRLESTLQALNVKLKNAQEQQAAVNAADDSKKRLEDLEAERKKLSAENDKIKNFLDLYDQYIEAYANAVQDPVNSMFKTARFRMFDTSEKGVNSPACIVCNEEWKEYDSMLSTGEKVGVDLDIVRVMQEKFGIKAPVWIDERQSYTGKIELDCQYFELISKVDESKSENCGDYKPWLEDNDKSCSNCMLLSGCNKHVLTKEV